MHEKTALGAALVGAPKVILLDEALNTLDPISAHAAKEALAVPGAQGAAVLLATHILPVAERMCDRVGVDVDQGAV